MKGSIIMIINSEKELNLESVERAVKIFSTKNELGEKVVKELLFICKQFVYFYNLCSKADNQYDIEQVFELFEMNLRTQADAGMNMGGIGLQTDAISMYKLIPYIQKLSQSKKKVSNKENTILKAELKKQIEKARKAEEEATRLKKSYESHHYSSGSSYSSGSCSGGGRYSSGRC